MKLTTDRDVSCRRVLAPAFALALAALLTAPGWAAQAPSDGSKQAVVTVQGMQCPFCAYGIRKHLAKLPGAQKVEVELAKNQAIVTFARDAKVGDKDIQQAVRNAGFTPGKIEWRSAGRTEAGAKPTATSGVREADQTAALSIEGMRCLGCEAKITADLEALPGMSLAQVDWQELSATVRYDANKVKPEDIIRVIEKAGRFRATLKTNGISGNQD